MTAQMDKGTEIWTGRCQDMDWQRKTPGRTGADEARRQIWGQRGGEIETPRQNCTEAGKRTDQYS